MGPVPVVAGRKYSVAPAGDRELVMDGACAEGGRVTDDEMLSAALEIAASPADFECAPAALGDVRSALGPVPAPPLSRPKAGGAAFDGLPAPFRSAISREISGPVIGPRRYESAHRL